MESAEAERKRLQEKEALREAKEAAAAQLAAEKKQRKQRSAEPERARSARSQRSHAKSKEAKGHSEAPPHLEVCPSNISCSSSRTPSAAA